MGCAARDGRSARAELQAARAAGQPVDLVLLDWVLPDIDGGRLLAELRADWPATQVVAMTAHGSPELSAAAAASGVVVIDKPVMPQDLRRLLAEPAERAAAVAAVTAGMPTLPLQGMRVLLVEDNALNRDVAQGLLGHQGVQLQLAYHGLEAVERLQAEGPQAFDLVLMDLQMPVLDGYDTVRQLRADKRFDALPILAMTAHAMAGEKERCLALGMQDYITKPLVPAHLYATLAKWGQRESAPPRQPAPVAGSDLRPSAAPPPSMLPPVAGVDMAQLLAHCDQNPALARRLLRGVATDYADGLAGWHVWLAQGDWSALRLAAHTLQGLAGTMAATALRGAAQALERAAEVHDAAEAGRQLPATEAHLARLLTALQAVSAQIADVPAPPGAKPPSQAAEGDLAALAVLLADSDSRAVEWWQAHEAALGQQLDPVALRALSRAIGRFDFDAALLLCQRVQQGRRVGADDAPISIVDSLTT